jgi:hypothetical protein
MAHRVNIMLDDTAWEVLKRVPKGERSRVVNTAITEWLKGRKRISAAQRMDALRKGMPSVATEDLVAWIRADRERAR